MTTLRGGKELKARIKALKLAFKPIGRTWGRETVSLSRSAVPVRTGRLRKSIRVRNATQKRTTVVAHFTAYFIDAGTKPHDIRPRKARRLVFEVSGRTIFARKVHHRGTKARPFRVRAANEALRRTDVKAQLIDVWNEAA